MRGLIKENPGPVRHQSNLHVDLHFSANATFTVFNGDLNNSGSISIIQCLVVQQQDGFTRREGGGCFGCIHSTFAWCRHRSETQMNSGTQKGRFVEGGGAFQSSLHKTFWPDKKKKKKKKLKKKKKNKSKHSFSNV
ncbi:hypothetical protein FQA47_021400 [Oryzias melastigma]|uniref:Uncharacterized protein n=1 Tax=Oryzias melastigma TaxID=30732 RepID=A0A834CJ25_ORYME|nr:hypothetical protein FQA47_021400 [Oryzias melastigma]